MTAEPALVEWAADTLESAEATRQAVPRLTSEREVSIADAYAIQAEVAGRRIAAGERLIGRKLGLTARAKQVQMNVAEPVYGVLLSGGAHPADDPIRLAELIHPRVEPEIVFLLGRDLAGPGVTAAAVVAATDAVCCGLEVIDSRYEAFDFTAADVIADNTSAARIVLGPRFLPATAHDWSLTGLLLEVDGEQFATATGAATMGHPAEAVAMLANWLAAQGETLSAGELIFTGGLTAAVGMAAGTSVSATFAHLGTVTARAV